MEEKNILNGKKVSQDILQNIENDCKILAKTGVVPRLEIISTGDNEASKVYIAAKKKAGEKVGISVNINHFSDPSFDEIKEIVDKLNKNKDVHGIIIQLPLSNRLKDKAIELCSLIDSVKDVDGLSATSSGMLNLGFDKNKSFFHTPCTPTGCIYLLDRYNIKIKGKKCLIINRSNIVGKPLSAMLLQRGALVQIAHNDAGDFSSELKTADIVFSATGIANFINKDMIKYGAVLIDIGISRNNGKISGDFSENCREIASFYTPVPGGIGPMTIAFLLQNTINSAKYVNNMLNI